MTVTKGMTSMIVQVVGQWPLLLQTAKSSLASRDVVRSTAARLSLRTLLATVHCTGISETMRLLEHRERLLRETSSAR